MEVHGVGLARRLVIDRGGQTLNRPAAIDAAVVDPQRLGGGASSQAKAGGVALGVGMDAFAALLWLGDVPRALV